MLVHGAYYGEYSTLTLTCCVLGAGPSTARDSEDERDKKVSNEWWAEHLTQEDKFRIELGGKLVLLAEILKMSESIGDKV